MKLSRKKCRIIYAVMAVTMEGPLLIFGVWPFEIKNYDVVGAVCVYLLLAFVAGTTLLALGVEVED